MVNSAVRRAKINAMTNFKRTALAASPGSRDDNGEHWHAVDTLSLAVHHFQNKTGSHLMSLQQNAITLRVITKNMPLLNMSLKRNAVTLHVNTTKCRHCTCH